MGFPAWTNNSAPMYLRCWTGPIRYVTYPCPRRRCHPCCPFPYRWCQGKIVPIRSRAGRWCWIPVPCREEFLQLLFHNGLRVNDDIGQCRRWIGMPRRMGLVRHLFWLLLRWCFVSYHFLVGITCTSRHIEEKRWRNCRGRVSSKLSRRFDGLRWYGWASLSLPPVSTLVVVLAEQTSSWWISCGSWGGRALFVEITFPPSLPGSKTNQIIRKYDRRDRWRICTTGSSSRISSTCIAGANDDILINLLLILTLMMT